MKRYQKIQEHIAKLEAEDSKLELALDDAYEGWFKTVDKDELSKYMDTLREQRSEVNIHLRVNRENLRFTTKDFEFSLEKHFEGDNDYCINMWLDDNSLPDFYRWLNTMMKEVE
jgi:hypothetical protein